MLEHLDQQMAATQQRLIALEQSRAAFLRRLMYVALLVELSYALYWKWGLPMYLKPWQALAYGAGLLVWPAAVWLGVKLLNAAYKNRIRANEAWLDQLRQEQALKLEQLKRKLNWYNTERLIHRYQSRLQQPNQPTPQPHPVSAPTSPQRHTQPLLASPNAAVASKMASLPPATPAPTVTAADRTHMRPTPMPTETPRQAIPVASQQSVSASTTTTSPSPSSSAAPPTPAAAPQSHLPRTMPVPAYMRSETPASVAAQSQNQSWMDKLVDMLVGESPSNSFALICEKCRSNNGLAPRDEMESIEFVCSACRHLNSRLKTTAERRASSPTRSIGAERSTDHGPAESNEPVATVESKKDK